MCRADFPVLVGMGAVASCTFPGWRACARGAGVPMVVASGVLGSVALIPHLSPCDSAWR